MFSCSSQVDRRLTKISINENIWILALVGKAMSYEDHGSLSVRQYCSDIDAQFTTLPIQLQLSECQNSVIFDKEKR